MSTKKQERQERSLARLEAQLSSGVKTNPDAMYDGEQPKIPLTDKDKIRIKKEITTLKTRV